MSLNNGENVDAVAEAESIGRLRGLLIRVPLETLAGMVVLPLITGEIAHAWPGALMGLFLGMAVEAIHELSIQYRALPSSTPNDQVE